MRSAAIRVVAGATVMAVTIPFRVASFLLLAACGALCQERAEKAGLNSLPDAPSARASARVETSSGFSGERGSAFATAERGATREQLAGVGRPTQPGFVLLSNAKPGQENSNDFFDKYWCPTLRRNLNYHPSSSDSLFGRAAYAASRIFVTRDESGKARVNTAYFVGVLSSAALHMAYRPYWNRSAATPFSDFGSTVGNDAGMNLLHEFRPGLEQLMKNHAPKFVSKIEESVRR